MIKKWGSAVAVAGRKPKPHLQAVREGTHRPDKHGPGAKFAPVNPVEPDWSDLLPGDDPEDERVRATAASTWARVVPALVYAAGLTDTQRETAVEYCLTVGRLYQAERALSLHGLVVTTERGQVKSPWTTIAHQYRSHFRSLVGELGLSPAAATRLTPANGNDDEDDDVFD